MTFTIVAIEPETGKMGFAITSSTPMVGAHAPKALVPGFGLVGVQAHSDYRRMVVANNLMRFGHTPDKVLQELREGDEYVEHRQFFVLDLYGRTAEYTGRLAPPWAGTIAGLNYVASGNTLVRPQVVEAMSQAYLAAEGQPLEERLMRGIEAGRDAGGQPEGQTSAAILVQGRYEFPLLNLRVDLHEEPIGQLRRRFDWYLPLLAPHVERTLNPASNAALRGFPAWPD